MISYNNLYEKICAFSNLLLAARKAQACKRYKSNVGEFNFFQEQNLIELQKGLINQTYQPGSYKEFFIYEPKKRMISAAPYRDRVVHHTLCNIIEPIFDRTFIYDSYANRKNKGTHKAVDRFSHFCKANKYVLKCDIHKYFPSIDHQILKAIICKKIACQKTLWLIALIIDNSNLQEEVIRYFSGDDLFTPISRRRGLPLGNLTSQFFANLYLNGFDHFVKQTLQCKYYIRYVDDFVILSNDKKKLHLIKDEIIKYLDTIRLRLHPKKSIISLVRQGTDFLGYKVFPHHKLLRRDNIRRFLRRMKRKQRDFSNGIITVNNLSASIRSWIAHASHANTNCLRKKLLRSLIFRREILPEFANGVNSQSEQ